MVLPIRLVDLVERLRDEEAADAVAGHEGQRRLEEIQAPQRRELIEHQQQLVAARDAIGAIERFGKASPDLVEDQADKRSDEHTSELQSLMRISYAVFCLKKK